MTFRRPLRALAIAAVLLPALAPPLAAQSFSAPQRSEIEQIVRDYLLRNPEILQEVLAELEKKQATADSEKAKLAVQKHSEALFNSPRHVVVGNPQGDVTLVEFFDYNCGYCKRALGDLQALMQADPKLRVVLKEFPVLGEGSVDAARVAAAVRLQDKTGKKYFDFHQRLLNGRGQVDKAKALAAARESGLDVARVERDMNGEEVRASLEESLRLAEALGLNGTPSYVVGSDVVVGAVGRGALQQKINMARCGQVAC